nr:MAG TPA: hypothetical protein [Caudoviricetes sp.]
MALAATADSSWVSGFAVWGLNWHCWAAMVLLTLGQTYWGR